MDESISLRELVDVDVIQSIQDRFAKTVGISSVIFLPDGDALTRFSNPTKFCSLIQSTNEGRRRCFQSFTEMSRKALKLSEPEIMYCFAYGAHFVAPIIIDDKLKATMYAGQFRPEEFSPEQLKELEKIAVEIDLDPELLASEATNMRTVREAVAWDCLHSFFRTVKVIAELGAQALELRQSKDALQKAHDELEIRVQERTTELTETNKELRREIAERKAAEGALRESEQNFRDLVGNLMDGVAIADENAYHIYVNPKFSEITGYSRDELLNMTGWDFTRPEDRAKLKQRMEDRMAVKPFRTHYDRIIVRKDKTEVPVEMSTTTTIWRGKKRPMAIIHDITERKRAEEALRIERDNFINILESMDDGVYIVNQQYDIQYVNPVLKKDFGSVDGRKCYKYFHDLDEACPWCKNRDVLAGKTVRWEWCSSRNQRTYDLVDTPLKNPDGSISKLEIFRDITERKHIGEKLRESEEKLRSIVEQSGDGIVLADEQGSIIEWNPGHERITGLSRADVLGGLLWDVQFRMVAAGRGNPEVYEQIKAGVLKVLKTGQSERFDTLQEIVIQRPDGACRVLQAVAFSIKTDKGFMVGAIARDITERKQAEEALRESEARIRALLNAPTDAMILIDSAGIVLAINNTHARWFKKSMDELIGKCIFDLFPSGMAEFRKAQTNRVFDTGKPIRFEESQGGKIFNTNVYPVFGAKGKVTAVAVYAQDITERKLVEDALKDSQLKYRQLFETMTCGVAIYEAIGDGDDFIFRDFNKAGEDIEQVQRDDVIGRRVTEAFPGVREFGLFKVFQRVWRTGKPEYFPDAIYRDGHDPGTWRENWVYKLPGGEIVAIYNDVTERKRVEQSLLEAEAELKHIIEVVPGIIAKVNAHTGYFTYCNPALSGILGFSPGELLARPFVEFVHPEDRQNTINEVEKQLKGSPLDMFENRYICKNGSYKWLEWRATAADDKEVIYAAATDITERKQAEDALRESEGKLRSIVEQSGDGIVLADEQGTIIEWNQGQERITGLSRAEVLGKYMWDVQFRMAAADRATLAVYEQVKAGVLKFLKTGQSGRLDKLQKTVIKRPDGARRVIQVAVFHIKTDNGFMAGAISRDITELSRAEDALRKSEEKYRALFETAKDAIFLSDEAGKFVDVNQAACESLGYSREELLRLSNREIDADPRGYEAFLNVRNALAEELVFEVNQQRKDGTLLPVEITGKFFKTDGKPLSLAIARDITERKAAEEQIKRSLREKDVLMHEMHHRVKNNLQVASSLLSMQARTTRNKEAIDVLSKSRNRINTMALIHTQLYESGDLSELNMKEFVGILSEELFRSYPVTDTKITHIIRMTDRKFPISVGMYVGLIINELLSNAIEHAFGNRKEGTIKVSLTASDNGRVNLCVCDDGIGLPIGFDIDKTRSLGLHLVKILVEDQLQGTLKVTSDGGATFNMEFDLNDSGGSSYGEDKNTDC